MILVVFFFVMYIFLKGYYFETIHPIVGDLARMICEKVYFIGYSFPETDVQMKIFVSNALRKNKNLKEVTIVSNPMYGRSRVDFEERYSPILLKTKNDPKIIFNYDGFERFSKEKLSEVDGRRKVIS